ncbi:MAG: ABC transporter ATP-binding protein [Anaerolineae bacterium]
MAQEPAILLQSVTRRFGKVTAVEDVSLTVAPGRLVGFIGPSGSGKTTCIRMLCGLLSPSEGTVRVLGKDPCRLRGPERTQIGYLPQHFLLYPSLSVSANLSFVAGLYSLGLRERGKRMREVLERVQLWEERGRAASDLSGGMQRRLALAATLVHNPLVLFLDEPTTGQDPLLRRRLWDWFRELERQGRTLIVTTHYVGDAELCSEVGMMDRGRLVAYDQPERLRRRAFSGDLLEINVSSELYAYLRSLERMPWVRGVEVRGSNRLLVVVDDAGRALPELATALREQGLVPDAIRELQPPFDDVFERLIRQQERREHRPT